MKLYLSSIGLPESKPFLRLFSKNQPLHIAVIPTAWSVYPREKAEPFIANVASQLHDIGCTTDLISLEDYDGAADALRTKLHQYAGCFVTGGNTFYLNYWAQKSGFDVILPELLQGGFVYAGESAGAAIAGKTLHGIELLDNPADAPEVIWKGLGLVDYSILPHWGTANYAGRIEQAYEEMRLFGPVKTITNNEAIITK